jgi:hypothetical protein
LEKMGSESPNVKFIIALRLGMEPPRLTEVAPGRPRFRSMAE